MTSATDKSGSLFGGEAAALADLDTMLVSGEVLVAHALQHRLFALTHRRQMAAVTTGRFLYVSRRLLGGFDPVSVRLQDLKDAQLTMGMLSATLTIRYSTNLSDTAVGEGQVHTLTVTGLTKAAAAAVYRVCEGEEQAWREKRRVRSMEEMRAQSGGVQIATGVTAPMPPLPMPVIGGSSQGQGPAERLAHAKGLLDQHLITDAEYQEIKAKIVGSL
jgi:hypothetical protein